MLLSLSIKNIVLIESLELSFGHGLSVFTGETGAGKSILLDALSLVLGARADIKLIRSGADNSVVSAVFSVENLYSVQNILKENAINLEDGNEIIIRRILSKDGKNKAFINDVPVSANLLKCISEDLIEIHGQFENHGLLNPSTHKQVLDDFGGLNEYKLKCEDAYNDWKESEKKLKAEIRKIEKAKEDEEYIKHNLEELIALKPEIGEEDKLASYRTFLMQSEKMQEALKSAYENIANKADINRYLKDAEFDMQKAIDYLKKANNEDLNTTVKEYEDMVDVLNTVSINIAEVSQNLENKLSEITNKEAELEQTEERLFAIRELARKHRVTGDDLPELMNKFQKDLDSIEYGEEEIKKLKQETNDLKKLYIDAAEDLHTRRIEAANEIDGLVMSELPPLKLEKAEMQTRVDKLEEKDWGIEGMDRVYFYATFNPGVPLELISKIASGGELARFMLALKVVLSKTNPISTFVFDEVDTGISGSTATAVGERLKRLAKEVQVLVITHSAQVAACGEHHFKVSKGGDKEYITSVEHMDANERISEIARIISDDMITEEAISQAKHLLSKS